MFRTSEKRVENGEEEAVAKSARQPTVPQARLIAVFQERRQRGFRILKSAEAPLIKYSKINSPVGGAASPAEK